MSFDAASLMQFLEQDGNERVGFVLKDGSTVEISNICQDPKNGFDVDGADLLRYLDDAVATWHTHPNATSNLSVGDLQSYLNYPELTHYIAGTDGVATYYVENGRVLRKDESIEAATERGAASSASL